MQHLPSSISAIGHNGGPPIETVWQPIPKSSQAIALDTRCHHTLYTGARGPGKALPVDTPILTTRGWTVHGALSPGDFVYGSNGTPVEVLAVFDRPAQSCYRLIFDDGTSIVASEDHLWQFATVGTRGRNRVETTRQLLERTSRGQRVLLPTPAPIDIVPAPVPFDSYMLGLLLGDGSLTNKRVMFCTDDAELADYALRQGFREWRRDARNSLRVLGASGLLPTMRELGIMEKRSHEKEVPSQYRTASRCDRLSLLQGLMDTDGSVCSKGYIEFCSVSKKLAEDVAYLVRSLGGKATIRESDSFLHGVQHRMRYRVYVQPGNKFNPFRLRRKAARVQPYMHAVLSRRLLDIQYEGVYDCNCIAVSAPDHLYVAGTSFVVTHNTDTQLMRFRRRVGVGYGAYWRGVIFDREYKNLDDLVSKSKRWFSRFDDGAKFLEAAKDYKWVWPTGEELLFRVAKKEADYWNYHGQEFPFIGWNELTKYPTGKLYDDMMSCNRSSFLPAEHTPKRHSPTGKFLGYDTADGELLPDIPLEVFSTCNPYGSGHAWVKRRFIDPVPYGMVYRTTTKVFNPRTQKDEDVEKRQIALFGSYRENIYLSPEYVAELEKIKDENKRKAWLMGSWDIVAGGALDDVWDQTVHVLPRFVVPSSWHVDRAFDWGSSHPFSVGWWAEANGEEAQIVYKDGRVRTFCPPAGTLIQIAEWYGSKEIGTNEGLKLSAPDIAAGIVERESYLMHHKWVAERPWAGPADNQIRDVREKDVETIEAKMAKYGIRWTESDKSPGSRKNGLQLIRDRLEASMRGEGPGLYFMENCRASISILPTLPRDEDNLDDVDTDAEDHAYDMVRYRVLRGSNRIARTVNVGVAC